MNNLLLILGMLALSNGNISLFDNKNKSKKSSESNSTSRTPKVKNKNNHNSNTKIKRRRKQNNNSTSDNDDIFKFNMNDISKGLKLMELSDEDLDRGMEIITRTKKYMSRDEKKILIKIESLLDLVKGIKKLSAIDISDDLEESNFFRTMDEEDKKNMMIREIIEVFPEKRKESVEKAIDIKKKIDLFAELFLPDDFGEGGFSLSSLADINNLGSISNLKLLGNLLRGDDDGLSYEDEEDDYDFEEDSYEEFDEYEDEEQYEYIDTDEDD
ncbi:MULTISPECIES: hypothetical protein [unclassified Romboutsia]|uniref:hypothetical protein n=1 Tax=unclassified Romboutsia TaxID=2626894 RepID=UPI0008204FD2|nr:MULTISPECIES: hypothetical protein [unclassified Romboutsia]SCH31424.1 Uncharacterised protein [uncultured Clostridium sp.]